MKLVMIILVNKGLVQSAPLTARRDGSIHNGQPIKQGRAIEDNLQVTVLHLYLRVQGEMAKCHVFYVSIYTQVIVTIFS